MPRKFDKYGFNRQYLRRPCTRANPFPHKLPFVDDFSLSALIHKAQSAPPTGGVSTPTGNVPAGTGPMPPGSYGGKRMRVTQALERFVKREIVSLGEAGSLGFIAGEIAEPGGPVAAVGGGLAVTALLFEGATVRNLIKLSYDLIHKQKRTGPITRSESQSRRRRFRADGDE
jgi:hypothetical protein